MVSTVIPKQYDYLLSPQMPRMIQEALKTYGTLESPGNINNPTILGWAKEVGVNKFYTADSIPWCGLWMAVIAQRSGWTPPKSPLWALSWSNFGEYIKESPEPHAPSIGDVLVFTRNGGGHVGLYVADDDTAFRVLGGNQSDSVCITRIAKSRLYTARRPKWRIQQPPSVKPVKMDANGKISTNER